MPTGGKWHSKRQPIYSGQGLSTVVQPSEAGTQLKRSAMRNDDFMLNSCCRPRASSVASDDIDNPPDDPIPSTSRLDQPVPKKPKRAPRKKAPPKNFKPTVEWPEHFTKLFQVFKVPSLHAPILN
jgi:hypothetical protein